MVIKKFHQYNESLRDKMVGKDINLDDLLDDFFDDETVEKDEIWNIIQKFNDLLYNAYNISYGNTEHLIPHVLRNLEMDKDDLKKAMIKTLDEIIENRVK